MFETEADRRSMLLALGGGLWRGPLGRFAGVLEEIPATPGEIPIDAIAPRLTVTALEADAAGVIVGALVHSPDGLPYVVRRAEPAEGLRQLEIEPP